MSFIQFFLLGNPPDAGGDGQAGEKSLFPGDSGGIGALGEFVVGFALSDGREPLLAILEQGRGA